MRVFMSKMILQLMALLGLSEMVFSEESDQFPPARTMDGTNHGQSARTMDSHSKRESAFFYSNFSRLIEQSRTIANHGQS